MKALLPLLLPLCVAAAEVEGLHFGRGTDANGEPIFRQQRVTEAASQVCPSAGQGHVERLYTLRERMGITHPICITGTSACLFETEPGPHSMLSLQRERDWVILSLHNGRQLCSTFTIPGGCVWVDPDELVLEEHVCIDRVFSLTIYYKATTIGEQNGR